MTILKNAIDIQIRDFFGSEWEGYKQEVAIIKQKEGEVAARKFVKYIIEESLFFPRKFKSALLGEEETQKQYNSNK